jgi:AcrR family transcriptional regulator
VTSSRSAQGGVHASRRGTGDGESSGAADHAAESTRERIVSAALRVFYERGTFGGSMRELASAADISVQGLYYHFASKQDLIRAAIELASASALRPGPSLPPDVCGRIMTQASAEFDAFVTNPEFRGLLASEAVRRHPDAIAAIMDQTANWTRRWEQLLRESADIGEDSDIAAAADFLTTFLWGLNISFVMTLDPTLRERIPIVARNLSVLLTSNALE